MQMAQRIPELDAAPEPRESPETASDARDGVKAPPEEERRPWWRKVLFGQR